MALGFTAAFMFLCIPKLSAQGLYYDEVLQAPAAFLLVGRPNPGWTSLIWEGVPLLTTPYLGAVKSILYGEWMRLSGEPFTVVSWRMEGILLVAAGLLLFLVLSGRVLRVRGLLVFALLFLSDSTVLITSRHDWGPTAFALACRLVWLGLWLRSESAGRGQLLAAFVIGFIPAFLIFEKLNNVVLLAPLALALLRSRSLRSWKSRSGVACGLLVGAAPFIFVNVLGHGISFRVVGESRESLALDAIFVHLEQILALGHGGEARQWILGVPSSMTFHAVEALLVAGVLSIIVFRAWRNRDDPSSPTVLFGTASFLLLATLTLMLPRGTWIHHWIVATPFQYVAMSAAFRSAQRRNPSHERIRTSGRASRSIGLTALAILLAIRATTLYRTEEALARGAASDAWNPAYTALARHVIAHDGDATFIAADWGFATSVYALSNGAQKLPEWFWTYRGRSQLEALLRARPGKPMYVVTRSSSINATAAAILDDARSLSSNRSAPDPGIAIPQVIIRGFLNPFDRPERGSVHLRP